MSTLNGRVRLLERRQRLQIGCPEYGRQRFRVVDSGDDIPAWLDGSSCCRGCGAALKLIDREAWGLL